jgi:hypothetical protein
MKTILNILFLVSAIAVISSCEKDEGKKPTISFKTGVGFTSSDVTLAGGSQLKIGIDAAKTEDKDVLKKFNISKSVNGGASVTVFEADLTGAEGDAYSHDYTEVLGNIGGEVGTYTFTITNRDGLTNQLTLKVTIEVSKPNISYKTGGVYISSDVALTPTSVLVVGINAIKTQENEVLTKFNLSKSVNGGSATTVFEANLTGADGDFYSHDYIEVIAGNVGDINRYTFTITNKDGITNQLTLKVTID